MGKKTKTLGDLIEKRVTELIADSEQFNKLRDKRIDALYRFKEKLGDAKDMPAKLARKIFLL